jgi:hypothetical protein
MEQHTTDELVRQFTGLVVESLAIKQDAPLNADAFCGLYR